MTYRAFPWLLLALAPLPLLSGCPPRRPAVVPVRGVVLLDNKPLPNAAVLFVPLLDDFGSDMNSVAMTDEQGRFTLKCNWQNQPGAAVARHKVLVHDAPPFADGAEPDADP